MTVFTTLRHTAPALAAVTVPALPAAASGDTCDKAFEAYNEAYNGSAERLNDACAALTE
ncbi:MAG: hypothetical protein GDA49_01020 [Rhodospirillales bacterium]|nr:hypothetical protein [Rhodospirillales bacterium]